MRFDSTTQNTWILGEELPGIRFQMQQFAEVVSGPDRGARGELISIYELYPEPKFQLETDNGGDVIVFQSQLEAIPT